MAVSKFLALVSGRIKEIVATVTSTGVSDEGKIVALDSTGRLDSSVLPVGIGAETKIITASEALSANNLVNIWNSAGQFRVRKADATAAGKEANGFVLAGVANGQAATVYLEGTVTGLGGLLPGRVYLSTVPGEVTDTPPSAAGNVVQYVGNVISTTEFSFEPSDGVILA